MYSICHMLTISKAHLHVALLQTTLDFHIQPSTLQLDLEVQINISNSLCPKSNSKSSPPKLLLTQTFFILINGNCIPLIALHKNLEVMTPLTLLHHIYQQFLFALLPKHIQNLTTSYHLQHYPFIQTTIIFYLNLCNSFFINFHNSTLAFFMVLFFKQQPEYKRAYIYSPCSSQLSTMINPGNNGRDNQKRTLKGRKRKEN